MNLLRLVLVVLVMTLLVGGAGAGVGALIGFALPQAVQVSGQTERATSGSLAEAQSGTMTVAIDTPRSALAAGTALGAGVGVGAGLALGLLVAILDQILLAIRNKRRTRDMEAA